MLCPSQSFLLRFHQRWESHLIGRYILHVKSKYENNIIIIKITAWPLALSCVPWFAWCCSLWSAHRLSPTPAEVQIRGNNSVGAQWGSSVWDDLCGRFSVWGSRFTRMLSCQSANIICFFQSRLLRFWIQLLTCCYCLSPLLFICSR